jgi:hypothetical protein
MYTSFIPFVYQTYTGLVKLTITSDLKFEFGQHKMIKTPQFRLLLRRRTVHASIGTWHDLAVSQNLHYSYSRLIVDALIVSWLLGKLLSLSLILNAALFI